jgi:SAM-dependent methyltransferase
MEGHRYSEWFETVKDVLEAAYLQHSEPWRQSGKSGPEEYWIAARRPVADCIEYSGSFLDIGCANGYLMECVVKWVSERKLTIIPYGIDLSEKLIKLAQSRLLDFRNNLFVGNGWEWLSPRRFDYVRTELVYVPTNLQRQYVQRILDSYLEDDGRLLVAEYRSRNQPIGQTYVEQTLKGTNGLEVIVGQPSPVDRALREWGFNVTKVVSGFWEEKEVTRVAVVSK